MPTPLDFIPEHAKDQDWPWSVDLYNPATSIPYNINEPSFEDSSDTGH